MENLKNILKKHNKGGKEKGEKSFNLSVFCIPVD